MLLIILSIDLIIGIIISIFSFHIEIIYEVLIGIGFGAALLFIEVLIFFGIVIIFTIPVKKTKRYKYSKFYARMFNRYERFGLRLFNVHVKVINKEIVPDEPFVLISNHRSNIDSFVIDKVLKKRKLVFAAKKSLFKIPWFGKLIWRNNYLYLTREDERKDYKELLYGVSLVNEGNYSIGIFPEGTRNKGEETLIPFLKGYILLLNKTKKPLVIACLKDTHKVNDKLFIKRHNVTLEFLETLDYEKYSKMSKDDLNNYAYNLVKECLLK